MIGRGTTPHHGFLIPEFDADILKIYVTYSQDNGKVLIIKEYTGDDLIPSNEDNGYKLIVNLTQEETLSFQFSGIPSKDSIEIQLRIYTIDDESYISNIIHELPGKVLYGGVIGE